ncbi:MAG: 50S ribosomal protein L6, partial [Candidatus Bathyarchaeia archaeon]
MRAVETSRIIKIPEDVEVTLKGKTVTVKGAKGTLTRDFSYVPISIKLQDREIYVGADWPSKKEAA